MNRLIVIGANGFIGANLTKYFVEKGFEVHVVVRNKSNCWRISNLFSRISVHEMPVIAEDKVQEIFKSVKPDAIINATGLVSGISMDNSHQVIESNFTLSVLLINAFSTSGIDAIFVNTGSSYEYGYSSCPLKETDMGEPIGVYGITKRAATEYAKLVSRKLKKKILTLRLFTPYGYYDVPNRLIPQVSLSLIRGKIPDVREPQSGRDFIFIDDLCRIYEEVMKRRENLEYGDIINVGTGKLFGVMDVVKILLKINHMSSESLSFSESESTGNVKFFLQSDNTKLETLIGKIAFTELETGLSLTNDWFKLNEYRYSEPLNYERDGLDRE